ncbi:MAG: phenylalanine--tRNA ligase subunit alpha, partial [Pseudomonadota bacterium]|nr:phenylalanine--tRNA ligase subunit alpha [Pseudomonadota bacterium]
MTDLEQLKTDALTRIANAPDAAALEALRIEFLGKQGSISGLMKTLGKMSPEERQVQGPLLN